MRKYYKLIYAFRISVIFATVVFMLTGYNNSDNNGARRLDGGVQVSILPEQALYDGNNDIMDDYITQTIKFEEQEILNLEYDIAYHQKQKEQQQQQQLEESPTAMTPSTLPSDNENIISASTNFGELEIEEQKNLNQAYDMARAESTSTNIDGIEIEKQKALNHAYDMARAQSTSANVDGLENDELETSNNAYDKARAEGTSTNSDDLEIEGQEILNSDDLHTDEQDILNHEYDMVQAQELAAKQEIEDMDAYFHGEHPPLDDDIAIALKQEEEVDSSIDGDEIPVDTDVGLPLLQGEDAQNVNSATDSLNINIIIFVCMILIVTNLIAVVRVCHLKKMLDSGPSSSIRGRSGATFFSIFGRRSRKNRGRIDDADGVISYRYTDEEEEHLDTDTILAELESNAILSELETKYDDCNRNDNNHYLYDHAVDPGRITLAPLVGRELSFSSASQQDKTSGDTSRFIAHSSSGGKAARVPPNRSKSTGTIRKNNEPKTTII